MAGEVLVARQAKHDLEAELHGLKTEARKLLGAAAPTPAQEARLAAIEADVEAKSAELGETLQELARLERDQEAERASAVTPPGVTLRGARGRRFADMFPAVPLSMGGFDGSEDFLASLHSGRADARLIADYAPAGLRATMTGTVPSDGGFSVPSELFRTWLDASLEGEIVRPRAFIQPMTSSSGKAPGWDDGDRSSTLYGGFTGQWVAEGSTVTETAPKMRLIELHARKLAILTRVSNELIADGVSFEQQLGGAITRALG